MAAEARVCACQFFHMPLKVPSSASSCHPRSRAEAGTLPGDSSCGLFPVAFRMYHLQRVSCFWLHTCENVRGHVGGSRMLRTGRADRCTLSVCLEAHAGWQYDGIHLVVGETRSPSLEVQTVSQCVCCSIQGACAQPRQWESSIVLADAVAAKQQQRALKVDWMA